jgi:hypothetical protein
LGNNLCGVSQGQRAIDFERLVCGNGLTQEDAGDGPDDSVNEDEEADEAESWKRDARDVAWNTPL